ncbi:hypothetical protein ACFQWB_15140 [Paenibacillus thermoaerophilus]|jgi:hypothetical protein|uniref:Uncharacterized protein n=1 Tax=Paenibacillus thermoaerophilus TaxID=1215385 RepID=A0ABW2V8N4_9BACL|nr:hypothetical protein [Paenibacillus thermoaerophilus]TMV17931.1 hypothetical protein FE781_05640 [Paenibacillus thermoaerophilus]
MNEAGLHAVALAAAASPEEAKPEADLKDVREAMYVLLVIVVAFFVLMRWAKKKAKRRRAAQGDQAASGETGTPEPKRKE